MIYETDFKTAEDVKGARTDCLQQAFLDLEKGVPYTEKFSREVIEAMASELVMRGF